MAAPARSHPDAWYEERRTYIGASDAPVLTGDDPWTSAYELWLEKSGQTDGGREDNAILRWGRRVEGAIASIYEDETGRELREFHKVRRHRRYPFIAANPDRVVKGEKRGVQIKSSWKPWDAVPDRVTVQVQHEMGVMGWDVVDVAVMSGFAGFAVYEVPRDDLMIERLFAVERAWWARHIVAGEPPIRTGRYLNALRGEDTMKASDTQVEWLRERRGVDEALARLKARKDGIDERVKRSMVGARRLNGSDYGVNATWVKAWSKDVEETDWQAVAAAYRQVIEVRLGPAEVDVDAIEGIHTNTVTRSGGGGLTVRWKDVEPTSEEE
jgi:putative phage-type endonuclease